ncbi:unnamed protein product [Arabis nemorensis]|uniref:GRF-type domain-containing protein n=1 Tax=Arabis nemorensis TaxID=586526 RepID=A0A565AXS4_9BRAS|nr:unnamed protein product [Arabis nemorensis]
MKVGAKMAQSSGSSNFEYKNDNNGVVCLASVKYPSKIVKAWTDDNPVRRFYSCGRGRKVGNGYNFCNFFRWFDLEKPHGWQYFALLEARDHMHEQKGS